MRFMTTALSLAASLYTGCSAAPSSSEQRSGSAADAADAAEPQGAVALTTATATDACTALVSLGQYLYGAANAYNYLLPGAQALVAASGNQPQMTAINLHQLTVSYMSAQGCTNDQIMATNNLPYPIQGNASNCPGLDAMLGYTVGAARFAVSLNRGPTYAGDAGFHAFTSAVYAFYQGIQGYRSEAGCSF